MTTTKQKEQLITAIVSLNKKKIEKEDVYTMSKKMGIPCATGMLVWNNFVQYGKINKRIPERKGIKASDDAIEKWKNKRKKLQEIEKFKPSEETAVDMIIQYMNGKDLFDILIENRCSIANFYNLIHELNISGTLYGRMILNPKKYAKVDVSRAIRWYRNPNSSYYKKNLSEVEKLQFKRVTQVLRDYL